MFGWKIVKETHTSADEVVKQIRDILFPKLEYHEEKQTDGSIYKFHLDKSIDSNLEAALTDLQDNHNGTDTQMTIRLSIVKLDKVRSLLDAHDVLDKDAQYVVIENDDRYLQKDGDDPLEHIKADELT